ncbi:MAG: cysteinyl-tRNA synthetase [Dasania sp.]|jgi:cysteinyl-tRNA synthetase
MMQNLSLYNSLSRSKETFTPIDEKNIRMYVCGPTVYDRAHIGNARPVVVFDLLYRLLGKAYGTNHVTYARNITDVDDKIMARADAEKTTALALTQKMTEYFHQDMDALGALRPDHEPRATAYIGEMIALIEKLIAQGHAYEKDAHVLFHTPSMKNYGALSNRTLDDMIAGARVEVAPYKKDATDFVLWKPSDLHQLGWDSPWGYGRPGWHVECSAMSGSLFGETFDIHGGGIDLIFPHHENEIAQSCCANKKPYVNYWLHNGFLQINGTKMSKSLGNFFTVNQLLNDHNIAGEVIRFVLLRTHYRQPLDWTQAIVDEAQIILNKWFRKVENITVTNPVLPKEVAQALCDDLNMPAAITLMHTLPPEELAHCLAFLGFKQSAKQSILSEVDIAKLITERTEAKKSKNFARADEIRNILQSHNITLEDTPQGVTWRYT